jgi:hypothetical protein
MVTWRLKSCPRCKGDVFLDRDQSGWYEQCLQCSYSRELPAIVEIREKVSQGSLGQAGGSAQARK